MSQSLWVIPHSIEEWLNCVMWDYWVDSSPPTHWKTYAKFKKRYFEELHTFLKTHMGIKRCRKKFFTWKKKKFLMSHPAYAKSKKLSKTMIRTFLKTNFSRNRKNVTKYITYPKISFQHAAERVLRPRKENIIQNRMSQNL